MGGQLDRTGNFFKNKRSHIVNAMGTRVKTGRKVDTVRASRDGHEYHEVWTARKALQLLWPDTDLKAIAVEGLSPIDQKAAPSKAVEIADLVLHYNGTSFANSTNSTVIQFKYSVVSIDTPFRASNAKKTVEKFAETYKYLKREFGDTYVRDKVDFQLITNQPIYQPFDDAITVLSQNVSTSGNMKTQADQFKKAANLPKSDLILFASKFKVIGQRDHLNQNKQELRNILINWSAANDATARSRLERLKELVRNKAGSDGANNNLILRTDILESLNIGDQDDLLPCPSALVDVGPVLKREQTSQALELLSKTDKPLLIHAAGGVGKTVFMNSLSRELSKTNKVIFFDSFGGGAYRSPEDARHLPKKGLIHIANTLAFDSLCDPLLPESPDIEALLAGFRRRIQHSLDAISHHLKDGLLYIFIDAIDNAEIIAKERGERSFSSLLLDSLDTNPISGLKLVVSCRTERKPSTTYAKFEEFQLSPFSLSETQAFLRSRFENISPLEIDVAYARSQGNPRVLDYLVTSGREALRQTEINNKVDVNEMLDILINKALEKAEITGNRKSEINNFLAGLTILPPPIPLDEYAYAHNLQTSAVESFVADLFPLLDRNNQGVMFRDEPTETYVREKYASSNDTLKEVAANLMARQEESYYAAKSLPGLLYTLKDDEQLFNLAFDRRIPKQVTSTVGARNIRYSRLKAATLHASEQKDFNRLVHLMIELAGVAEVEQRGIDYITNNPDLIIAFNDVDALRRLFECRTKWPGTRHSRLSIAYTLTGDFQSAHRHTYSTNEWIEHYIRLEQSKKDYDRGGPDPLDIAAIPFFLISQGKTKQAVRYFAKWQDWYSIEIFEHLESLINIAIKNGVISEEYYLSFIRTLDKAGLLLAALSLSRISKREKEYLGRKLVKIFKRNGRVAGPNHFQSGQSFRYSILKSSAHTLASGHKSLARYIANIATSARPGVHALLDNAFYQNEVFNFIVQTAIYKAVKNQPIHEKDVLPKEIAPKASRLNKNINGEELRKTLKAKISSDSKGKSKKADLSYQDRNECERFIDYKLNKLFLITKTFTETLMSNSKQVNKKFTELVDAWKTTRSSSEYYASNKIDRLFLLLGFNILKLSLEIKADLNAKTIKVFLDSLNGIEIPAPSLIKLTSILANRKDCHDLCGEVAARAANVIDLDYDVSTRADLFAQLSRSVIQASSDDASTYFHMGLEQMDSIGSGDYEFTNELLLFASSIEGDEIDEQDFHALSNICELNLGDEPHKFYWGAYGNGLARVSGIRGLAKLSRLDDRSRISLAHTLLPYLTALVKYNKISPKDAIALNYLADPVEYHHSGTNEFIQEIFDNDGIDSTVLFELICQFQRNNPGITRNKAMLTLSEIAAKLPEREQPNLAQHLKVTYKHYDQVIDTLNDQRNHHSFLRKSPNTKASSEKSKRIKNLSYVISKTDVSNIESVTKAIDILNSEQNSFDLKGDFFEKLRKKVKFGERKSYINNICGLENLSLYWKLDELKQCKSKWISTSPSLKDHFQSLSARLVTLHAGDIVQDSRLSGYLLTNIFDVTETEQSAISLELVKILAQSEEMISGTIWLGLASFISPKATHGVGQKALSNLLRSNSAKLASKVPDGDWEESHYPSSDLVEVASGLVWRMLGSPNSVDRWHAAHSVRCFARFGRWDVIEALISRYNEREVPAFQAPELPFFYLHARLWLLIALDRIAIDAPNEMSNYNNFLIQIVKNTSHVLKRHFASQTLLTCFNKGSVDLDKDTLSRLQNIDKSPYSKLNKRIKTHGFYHHRPDTAPKKKFEFNLEYDFQKMDVDGLSSVFGKSCWEVSDMIAEVVHEHDSKLSSMHDSGGREVFRSHREVSNTTQSYGEQFGWHGLLMVAGELLDKYPVTDDYWGDNPWEEWFHRYTLTRNDGLWLSDGTDQTPIETTLPLFERKKNELIVTGDKNKILQLVKSNGKVAKDIVVEGSWASSDNIKVSVSSALAPPNQSATLIKNLLEEDPMFAYVPCYRGNEYDSEYIEGEKNGFTPWIVHPHGECGLDEHDPYGVTCAHYRMRLGKDFRDVHSLSSIEPFDRVWLDKRGSEVLWSQAWGRNNVDREDGPHPGSRLICRSSFLKKILSQWDKDLVILIRLQHYKNGYRTNSEFKHTVAVVKIEKGLKMTYHKGCINKLHQSRF